MLDRHVMLLPTEELKIFDHELGLFLRVNLEVVFEDPKDRLVDR